jgi:hypothetical protein
MTLDEFAIITRRVITDDGFEEYLPTACYPVRRHVKTLVGLPQDIKPDQPVLEWAAEGAQGGEEFLVAFKVDESHFKIIRRVGSYSEDETYSID